MRRHPTRPAPRRPRPKLAAKTGPCIVRNCPTPACAHLVGVDDQGADLGVILDAKTDQPIRACYPHLHHVITTAAALPGAPPRIRAVQLYPGAIPIG